MLLALFLARKLRDIAVFNLAFIDSAFKKIPDYKARAVAVGHNENSSLFGDLADKTLALFVVKNPKAVCFDYRRVDNIFQLDFIVPTLDNYGLFKLNHRLPSCAVIKSCAINCSIYRRGFILTDLKFKSASVRISMLFLSASVLTLEVARAARSRTKALRL